MTKTTDDITVSNARLDDLEQDLRVLLSDARSGGDAKGLIAEVVTDSDFIPQDEQSIVALEMYERIVEDSQ